jgi:hypothetical protein
MKYRFITSEHGTLKPADQETFDKVLKYGKDKFLIVDIKSERNPKHSNLYWAIMNFGYQHLNEFIPDLQSAEELSHLIQRYVAKEGCSVAGRFIRLKDFEHFERTSLSFGQMSQEQFSEYYEVAIPILLRWLKGAGLEITKEELEYNSEQYYSY